MENEIDKSNLRRVIIEYPNQLQMGVDFGENVSLELQEKPSNLIICGMGGSALPADMLEAYLRESGVNLPIFIKQNYSLPSETDKNSLVFISSYSGNTEETVECFKEALQKNLKIIAFSEGGKVEEIAKENNLPHIKYKIDFENFQPRYGTTYAFVAMNKVLTNLGISASIDFPSIYPLKYESFGKDLAQKIKNKIPVIYSSEKFGFLAKTWKIKINENSKHVAFWNVFPALNHNEMIGFSNPDYPFFVLMLKDKKDHPRNQARMDLTAEIYKEKGIEVEKIEIEGETFLEKVLNTSIIGDWISYYLAIERGIDPNPVDLVKDFKIRLN